MLAASTLAGTYGLSALAGLLSTLSPCVLPLIPIIMGSSLAVHRYGPLALASGLVASFTLVGVLLARLGFALGVDADLVRAVGAGLLVVIGAVLLVPALQARFAHAAQGITAPIQDYASRLSVDSLGGQWLLGALLGVVWSPCVGPTLGAAATLASQGQSLGQVVATMAFFGLGASVPMLALGTLSSTTLGRYGGALRFASLRGRQVLGALLVLLGGLVLTHADRTLEAWLVAASPEWLTALTTRY